MASTGEHDDGRAAPGELLDIADVRELLGVGRTRAHTISRDRTFPDPWLNHPQLRLWRRRDVEAWMDRWRPGWREGG